MPKRFLNILVVLALAICMWPASVRADEYEDEMGILQMYYDDQDLRVSVTRNEVPLSSVAEIVTVITSEEIRVMNAHTVADVLAHVPGIQSEIRGGPGTINGTYIRGGHFQHVRVLLDGVTLNSFSSSSPDLDAVPAGIVERIEVMRGPASSSWGSALGGVVNIVTKSAPSDRKISGEAYASGGESSFHDMNLLLSGTLAKFSYLAFGSHLGESGLTERSSVDLPAGYAKFQWEPNQKAALFASVIYSNAHRAVGDGILQETKIPQLNATIRGTYSIYKGFEVEVAGRAEFEDFRKNGTYYIFGPDPVKDSIAGNGHAFGGSALVRWQGEKNSLVAGFERDEGDYSDTTFPRKGLARSGVFLSDTITFGPVAVTPSIRYDWTNGVSKRHDFNPSIGVSWHVSDGTTIRASAAKGYNLPEIADTQVANIWSVQGGVETTEVPFLWLRGTFFYNEIKNQWVVGKGYDDVQRIGYEVEARTVPIYNLSLSGGAMFMDSESMTSGKTVKQEPRKSFNVGLRYDDVKILQVYLLGRYVDWNALKAGGPFTFNPDCQDFIWDLHVSKKLSVTQTWQPEIFFSLHNIFDGDQYLYQYWKNPGRWAEGGVRFSF